MKKLTKAQKTSVARWAVDVLKERYPEAICSLQYADPFRLLVAVRLSAQCTDARVNQVTPALFARFPDAAAFAAADPAEVGKLIYSCGFYNSKSRDLVAMARQLLDDHDGVVPDTVEQLVKLPGVGRKTANLICGDVYHRAGVVVADTHCIRISGRLGLCDSADPVKVETQLRVCLPPEESNDFCHRLVLFGRDVCTARAPKCGTCPLRERCAFAGQHADGAETHDR